MIATEPVFTTLASLTRFRYTGRPMLRLAAAAFVVAFAFSGIGCVSDSSTALTYGTTTLLSADPSTFLGPVRCDTGELRKYVVTLYDVTTGTRQKVGTSPATACTAPTSFGSPIISEERYYAIDVDGYDRDVVVGPLTDPDSGLLEVVDTTTMQPVAPKWTTTCGEAPWLTDATLTADGALSTLYFPTKTSLSLEVIVHPCLPLHLVGSAGTGPADAATEAASEPDVDAPSTVPEGDAGDVESGGDAG